MRDYIKIILYLVAIFLSACAAKEDFFLENPLEHNHPTDADFENYLNDYRYQYNFWLGQNSGSENLLHYTSTIDENFRNKLKRDFEKDVDQIAISSTGGYAEVSTQIGEFIYDNDIKLHIYGFCMSACAEDIITSSKDLILFDRPLIGFHGNSLTMLNEIKSNNAQDPCPDPVDSDEFRKNVELLVDNKTHLYMKAGKKINFWKETKKRLGNIELDHLEIKQGTCSIIQNFDEAEFWLPTSAQLSNFLGLTFRGELCADFEDCYKSKLLVYFGPGRRFIVGDELIVTSKNIID